MLLISSSRRSETSVSTTDAFAPGYTVVTETMGGSMSGNSRTGSRVRPITPKRIRARLIMEVSTGRLMLMVGRNMPFLTSLCRRVGCNLLKLHHARINDPNDAGL